MSIRAQIINLLLDLQDQFGLSYLMISHDLSVVEHMSDRVMVMFFGQIVEQGGWRAIFEDPRHPYTRRLIDAIPDPDRTLSRARAPIGGNTPPAPEGWRFGYDGSVTPNVFAPPEPSELVPAGEDHAIRLIRA
jgi:peptide/nickel transport system ATP-binding protein